MIDQLRQDILKVRYAEEKLGELTPVRPIAQDPPLNAKIADYVNKNVSSAQSDKKARQLWPRYQPWK
ncbi:uncharacterized protein N7446_010705 [Penicillium canescens]|uniref:Uncharacterized protein n=1 Tax=Penicillium canescens TaxID=5083 RepID=A0AAD6IC64_PENCN|nr:uncharacterized protein N7446_010705 [Penicillium canescens]KAJ6041406.1 hypothetical protein N7460_006796 [Penicillium canescens]KAJ6050596.1 hypothetical protein N7446_010705 [Penicillium canescens]KAJ6065815.1 hypothetical protein N7444_001468 [Penicillium canescens]